MNKLLPCPFCKSENLRHYSEFEYWIECFECGSRGPLLDRLDDATRAWNRAPRQAQDDPALAKSSAALKDIDNG